MKRWPHSVEYRQQMVKYRAQMVKLRNWMMKYWASDGAVQAFGWIISGLEILPEELGNFLEKNKTNGWLYRQN